MAQVTVITDTLHTAITHLSNQFSQEYQQLKEQLEDNHNWQKLTLVQQQYILGSYEPEDINVNTIEELIDSLEACSIQHWNDRTQAQSSKFDSDLPGCG
ncbi:MAG: hypothetical protein ACU88J_04080 [Gammaproteobacteria bacterium]